MSVEPRPLQVVVISQQVSLLHRPAFWAVAVAVVFVIFNVVFW